MPVGTVVARNLLDGITVLSADIKGTHTVEWGASGDPDGNDVQYIPEEVAGSVGFRRAISRGVIELVEDESDPTVAQAILAQVQAFQRRQAGAQAQQVDLLEKPANNDSVMLFCIGPNSRGADGGCGQPVPVRDAKKDDAPPLCNMHRLLAPQFIAEQVSADGKKVTKWVRVTLGAREVQHAGEAL